MSYTYKIKTAKRFLRKWTAAQPSPVTQAAIDAQTVANTLCDIPWEAVDVSRATLPSHDAEGLDDNVTNRDSFDAAIFCAGHSGGNHRVYANAACYVVKLPDDAVGKTLESLKVRAMGDPYNSAGLRIAVHTNSTGVIPTDCATARTGIAYASGKAPRTTQTVDGTAYWYAAEETVTLTPETGTLGKYLMVVVALENYATSRGNWLEGSGCIDGEIEITVNAEISGMDGYSERQFVVATAGNYPFLTGTNTGVKALSLQANGSPLPEYMSATVTGQKALRGLDAVIKSLDGEVTAMNVMLPVERYVSDGVSKIFQYAVIAGKFSQSSFVGFSGILIYDIINNKLIENLPALENALIASDAISALSAGRVTGAQIVSTNPLLYGGQSNNPDEEGLYELGIYLFLNDGAFVYNNEVVPVVYLNFAKNVDTNYYDVLGSYSGLSAAYSSSVQCTCTIPYYEPASEYYCSLFSNNCFLFVDEANSTIKNVVPYDAAAAHLTNGVSTNKMLVPRGGSIAFPNMSFSGSIHGIVPVPVVAQNVLSFVVYGLLSSVNGTSCSRIARVSYNGTAVTVSIPTLDTVLASRCSGAFKLGAEATISGAGQYALAYEGSAYRCWDDGTIAQISNLSNVSISDIWTSGNIILASEVPSTTPAGYDPSKLDTAGALNADASIGLRSLYAKLYGGELDNITLESSGMSLRPGAGFAIKGATLTLPTTDGNSASVFLWQIACAYMVLPFAAPRDFHVSKIRLAWSSLASTRGTLAVWLNRGAFVSDAPDLKDPAYFLASKGEIDGWELVGTVDPSANSIDFAIDPIEDLTATLMFTACASMDDVNPTTATTLPQGVATGLSVDPVTKAVSGTSGTWQPSVTLVE